MPRILVDADSCPISEDIIAIAHKRGLPARFYSRQPHPRLEGRQGIELIACGEDFDETDDTLVDDIHPQDIVITADIRLARRALDAGSIALGYRGPWTADNIGQALAHAKLGALMREKGLPVEHTRKARSKSKLDLGKFRHDLNTSIDRTLETNS